MTRGPAAGAGASACACDSRTPTLARTRTTTSNREDKLGSGEDKRAKHSTRSRPGAKLPPMSIVSGRVRPTVRLRQDQVDAVCVLATSWSSERTFPRTVGVGVPFEIETAGGEILRVDPFDAVVALPVRRYERSDGVSREYAWIGPDDEVTVEGDLDAAGEASAARLPPALHATRIAAALTGCARHHIPPRALRAGEIETHAAGSTSQPAAPSQAGAEAPPLPRRRRKRSHTPPA